MRNAMEDPEAFQADAISQHLIQVKPHSPHFSLFYLGQLTRFGPSQRSSTLDCRSR